jgi:alkanesulfonate monooxygenase SsuD/methylene tetrahydromethanopterin reductase-like flavin-dependent oxidoreductase (luciferase family)
MRRATHWGVWLHAVRPASELAELAAAAEALGAAAVLVADEGTDRDLFVTLTALAQRTRRALLFGAVTNPHSRHPVTTAAAFASLAELAPGRIVAGFGAGGSRVFGPMGLSPRRPFTALAECVDVVERLWRGETVDHAGEFSARGATLPWSPGPLPVAVAGRGPRVERLAAERADWILLAGRPIHAVAPLVDRLRSAREQPAAIAWNPNAAWTDAMRCEMQAHLAYMAVDMPAEDRAALAADPGTLLERYAVVGERRDVVARLSALVREVQPELLLFDADDYSVAFLESAASVAMDAGVVAVQNEEAPYGLDSHR